MKIMLKDTEWKKKNLTYLCHKNMLFFFSVEEAISLFFSWSKAHSNLVTILCWNSWGVELRIDPFQSIPLKRWEIYFPSESKASY